MFITLLPFLPWVPLLPIWQLSYVSLRLVRVCLKRERCVDLQILLAFALIFRVLLECYCRSTYSLMHIFLFTCLYLTPSTILDFYSRSACSLRSSKLDKLLSLSSCLCWMWALMWVNDCELLLLGWLYSKWEF